MTGLRFIDHFLGPDTHSNRPAASAVPKGAKYVCTTHGIIYSSDQTSWTTWATLGGSFTDPTTTKGDLLARGSSSTGRLAVGTDGQVLTADAASTLGVKWAAGGGGGGGLAASYLGKNAIGASWQTLSTNGTFKKVTTAGASELLSVGAYLRQNTDTPWNSGAALFSDNAGTPNRLLALNTMPFQGLLLNAATGEVGASGVGRWFTVPLAYALAAATDYWVGIWGSTGSADLAYDTGGSDRTYHTAQTWSADWGRYTAATTTRDHSIRARILS